MKLHALVLAAHPDDAEISLGGTILQLVDAQKDVGILDLTRGEMGTRGTQADRDRETARANELLGIRLRRNLELPDGRVRATVEAREQVAAILRELRPEVVFAPHTEDLHPDHVAAGRIAREAWYLAGLAKLAEISGGAAHRAHRPPRIYHYMGHVPFEPTLVVDVGAVWERKVEVIRCYASQITPADPADEGRHLLFGADILGRAESKARYYGERIGVTHGEPLLHLGPLPATDGFLLL
ncbi:MAG: bacillithiol biosynthesis deacetylase BshB1 [Planctomycetota bacterium]|nr:bacillithiol biosynthesis deacetylase BshB1 [Planctomycetota bacterium]